MGLITVHSSSHADNLKNGFQLLGEGDVFGFNGTFSALEKKISINFSKANTKLCLSLHCNALESVSNGFRVTESREVSLNGNV